MPVRAFNIEALLYRGHSVFVFIDGPSNDAEVFDGVYQSCDRLHVFANPENRAWGAVESSQGSFDVSTYRYVNFIDGGNDKILPDALYDFQDLTWSS